MTEIMCGDAVVDVVQDGPWYLAYSDAVPGANGQGRTIDECLASWREAAALMVAWRQDSR